MLKKVIGIICPVDKEFDDNSLSKPLGGSETWILSIANEFINHNYHVIIFNNNSHSKISKGGIEILNISLLETRLAFQYFTHIFILRKFDKTILDIIKKHNCCDNIYYVLHDMRLWKGNPPYFIDVENCYLSYHDDIETDSWIKEHVKAFLVMSDWHKNINTNSLLPEKTHVIGNGTNYLSEQPNERDNSILWSSCYNRGLNILVEKIAPYILEKYPDFKIYTTTYDNNQNHQYESLNYVVNLGSLNKNDLYKEISKHKVWFLPLVHWETFCITLIENIVHDVEVVCENKFGLSTVLKYFDSDCLDSGSYDDSDYCKYVANTIIDRLDNYYNTNRINIRKIKKNYILDNYSWNNIYNKIYNILRFYETNNNNNI